MKRSSWSDYQKEIADVKARYQKYRKMAED